MGSRQTMFLAYKDLVVYSSVTTETKKGCELFSK